ncbi:MAG: hypothetical protein ACI4TK_16325 [Agathobacter sp.]
MAKAKYEYWKTPEGLLMLEGWARDGLTDEQISENMGISRSTLGEWKKNHPDISDTLKKGKEVADRQVENALFERAIGGVHEVKKTFKVKEIYYDDHGRKCEKEKLVVGTDEVYVPGDTTAQIFWLKNRKSDTWKDKQSVEMSGLAEEQAKFAELLEQRRQRRDNK